MKFTNTRTQSESRVRLETEKRNNIFVEEMNNEPVVRIIDSRPDLREFFEGV